MSTTSLFMTPAPRASVYVLSRGRARECRSELPQEMPVYELHGHDFGWE
jgi:hypothetical protein